jgi:NAD(P)-dependent dehydrogenase (short-subunit alcohol dehydrogenase family)
MQAKGLRLRKSEPNRKIKHINKKMKIVVIGASGRIGSRIVENLRQGGHEVLAASPSTGVNTITGEGLAEALAHGKGQGGPEFKCKAMLWPVTDANFDTESNREYAEGLLSLAGDDAVVLGRLCFTPCRSAGALTYFISPFVKRPLLQQIKP